MDVLELTAVSAIVLDLLSGFQRPSRYRPTAPAEPAVVRVLERLRQADPQTGPPMRLHAGGRLLPDGRSPVNFQWIRDVAPEGTSARPAGVDSGGAAVSRPLAAPCQSPPGDLGRPFGGFGPGWETLGLPFRSGGRRLRVWGSANRTLSRRTRPRRQRSATRMARRSSRARSTSSFTTT